MTGNEEKMFDSIKEMTKAMIEQTSEMQQLLAHKPTISEATDWPMLVTVGGMLLILIGVIWKMNQTQNQRMREDLHKIEGRLMVEIKENRDSQTNMMAKFQRELDKLWAAFRTCQDKCRKRIRDKDKIE